MSIQKVEIRQTLGPISTVEVRQGPKGDHADAEVTNAAVNTAIEADAAATRTSLGLGGAATKGSTTLYNSALDAGKVMEWGETLSKETTEIFEGDEYFGNIRVDWAQGEFYSQSGITGLSTLTGKLQPGTLTLIAYNNTGDNTELHAGLLSIRTDGYVGANTSQLWWPFTNNVEMYIAVTSDQEGKITSSTISDASASFVSGKAIIWGTTAAGTRSALGAVGVADDTIAFAGTSLTAANQTITGDSSMLTKGLADGLYSPTLVKDTATTVNNSTTLVNSQLVSGLLTPGTYVIDFMLDLSNATTSVAGQKLKANFTGTATGEFVMGPDTGNYITLEATITQASGYGWRRFGKGIIVASTPGIFSFQFAQSTANASNTVFTATSWMTITKVQ